MDYSEIKKIAASNKIRITSIRKNGSGFKVSSYYFNEEKNHKTKETTTYFLSEEELNYWINTNRN